MTIDEYYAAVPEPAKQQLAQLRTIIIDELSELDEVINYQVPHFRVETKRIVAIGGYTAHVALYPLSGSVLPNFAKELAGYKTSAGTVQFPLDKPLPEQLIRRITAYRLTEALR